MVVLPVPAILLLESSGLFFDQDRRAQFAGRA
jgi:hypothetical protein